MLIPFAPAHRAANTSITASSIGGDKDLRRLLKATSEYRLLMGCPTDQWTAQRRGVWKSKTGSFTSPSLPLLFCRKERKMTEAFFPPSTSSPSVLCSINWIKCRGFDSTRLNQLLSTPCQPNRIHNLLVYATVSHTLKPAAGSLSFCTLVIIQLSALPVSQWDKTCQTHTERSCSFLLNSTRNIFGLGFEPRSQYMGKKELILLSTQEPRYPLGCKTPGKMAKILCHT